MSLIRWINIRFQRAFLLCLAILLASSLTGRNLSVSYAQEETYEELTVFLNNIKSVSYYFTDHEGVEWRVGFRTVGEDTVDGEATLVR